MSGIRNNNMLKSTGIMSIFKSIPNLINLNPISHILGFFQLILN